MPTLWGYPGAVTKSPPHGWRWFFVSNDCRGEEGRGLGARGWGANLWLPSAKPIIGTNKSTILAATVFCRIRDSVGTNLGCHVDCWPVVCGFCLVLFFVFFPRRCLIYFCGKVHSTCVIESNRVILLFWKKNWCLKMRKTLVQLSVCWHKNSFFFVGFKFWTHQFRKNRHQVR